MHHKKPQISTVNVYKCISSVCVPNQEKFVHKVERKKRTITFQEQNKVKTKTKQTNKKAHEISAKAVSVESEKAVGILKKKKKQHYTTFSYR